MSKEPSLPLRIKEFLKDTYGMTAEEIGGYIALLLAQWDKGSLPDDDKKLKGMAKVGLKSIQNIKKAFPTCEDGSLKSEWLDKQRRFYKKQAENGKKGGKPKHNPNIYPNDKPNGTQSDTQTKPKNVKKNEITPLLERYKPPIIPLPRAKETFKSVLQAYPGTKRGLEKEWDNFIKKCKGENIPEILEKMQPMIELETKHKTWMKYQKGFQPAWKNFQTWINGRCWEQEFDADFVAAQEKKISQPEVVNPAWENM